MHASVILEFLLFWGGRITEYWGLVTFLPQLVKRAGLHLEDQHLSSEQRNYRCMLKMTDHENTWRSKESWRRLFWVVFLLDHFASILSGTRSSFECVDVRRLLPCDGQQWQDNKMVHTREFIQATVAVQVQITPDDNIGGFAYLIEATEILALVTKFVNSADRDKTATNDPRGFLREFLSLDLILVNWKSRLPTRYQHASTDTNGYMDHNITLAHLTHNTSGILLYQSARGLVKMFPSSSNVQQSPVAGHLTLVKQAATEIGMICSRFLLHRRYIVSPQFCFCQFIAARALLAYSSWTSEPLDDTYETILASLSESSKRWAASGTRSEETCDMTREPVVLDNLASQQLARLRIDARNPQDIDLASPWTCLQLDTDTRRSAPIAGPRMPPWEQSSAETNQNSSRAGQASLAETTMSLPTASVSLAPFMTPMDTDQRTSALLSSMQCEEWGDRIFSWKDCNSFLIPNDDLQVITGDVPEFNSL
jgi:hypothetical protein